jgi:hypothetical protein
MRSKRFTPAIACLFVCVATAQAAAQAADYPLTLAASAQVTKGATTIATTFTIHLDRLIHETFRTRVTDALKFGGYPKFLPALRALPAIGTIEVGARKVELKYAREEKREKGIRLVLVADQPLFFLPGAAKAKAGYELTVVDLNLDAKGSGTGTMAGAARVKPAPDDGVVLDDFAETPVELTVRRLPEK